LKVTSTTGTPTSTCFNTPTIRSALNRFFFISKKPLTSSDSILVED
jgi:hypothetical protein